MAFNRLILPSGEAKDLSAALTAIELPKDQHATVSTEGVLSAGPAGLRSTAVDFAITYAVGKLTDDLAEEGVKALLVAIGPAAVATAARYIGLGAGVAWYLAHRGREAVLPRYAYIDITFNRPIKLEPRRDR